MKVYNTLTRKKQLFKPSKGNKVNLFVCGITPYFYAHIGHAKTYIQFDIIVRYLRYKSYEVFYLQNVTDLDDKIIARAQEENREPLELAHFYEESYHKDMEALNVTSVNKYARATDYIPAIIKQVKTLMDKGFAYEIEDGIYFDLSKFPDYGKLSGRTSSEAEDSVSRIDESKGKRNKGDFCLWKRSKKNEPVWPSPWFPGRPGWHIEDTAITESFFGPQYDAHGGARDLIFPHHEAEITQMESTSGKQPFVRYWLHTGFLTVHGEKMSKSLGNFITIRDALKKWGTMPLRFLFATSHYRSPIDFTEESIQSAKSGLDTLQNTLINVRSKELKEGDLDKTFARKLETLKRKFVKEMDDDFNTPKAAAVLFGIAHELNSYNGAKESAEKGLDIMLELADVFGIELEVKTEVPDEIYKLVELREKARAGKEWKEADRLRNEINKKGYRIDDSQKGTILVKIQ